MGNKQKAINSQSLDIRQGAICLLGRSLVGLLRDHLPNMGSSGGGLLSNEVARTGGGEGEGGVGHPHLFCEVGKARAVFTQRHRLIYTPQIKPLSKGGATDVRHNYQAHKHHRAYWKPLQFYDLVADPSEQTNLFERPLRTTGRAEHAPELTRLRALLSDQLATCRGVTTR